MSTTLRDLLASIVRTAVPYGVGALLAWLGRKYGLVLSEDASANAMALAGAVAGAAYYSLVRLVETKWPAVGVLLGWKVQPQYPAVTP